MQFINSSLDTLVKNSKDKDFKYLSENFSGKCLEIVKEKGVYPYEYMDSFKKFNETKLPTKEKFLSSLKNEGISEKDYSKAKNIWNIFNIQTLREYHDLYLKADVLLLLSLLCDVFEKFINTCLNYYGLDPCHYFSSPGLSLDAILKMTIIELKLINDFDMHLFIEKGMRGGFICISYRANTKYIKCYYHTKEIISIMYFDVNNLYGWEMVQYLPYGGFKWLTNKEVNYIDFSLIKENSSIGYILEVDVEYRSELHDLHNDYPLALEKLKVTSDMLSKYSLTLLINMK